MKNTKEGVKAIIFDVGGVLALGRDKFFKSRPTQGLGVHTFVAKKLKISLDHYFDSIDTAYAKSIDGKISRKQVLKTISKNLETSERKIIKLYAKAYKKNFKQNKKLLRFAADLKKRGYGIAILSDQWPLSYDALMPKKLYSIFGKKVVSHIDKIRKPNLGAYKLILKKLKLKPNQTVFIDNREWNIKPAKKLGMKTILFKTNKQLFEQLAKILK